MRDAKMACTGQCGWEFKSGHWVLITNPCGGGCSCTGPLPLGPPGTPPQFGVGLLGNFKITDALLRSTFSGHAIPSPGPGASVDLPCVSGAMPSSPPLIL